MWSDRCSSLLQQEQDWGEISNCQMFLLPWSGCWHHPSDALLCWWYVCVYSPLPDEHLLSSAVGRRHLWLLLSLHKFHFSVSGDRMSASSVISGRALRLCLHYDCEGNIEQMYTALPDIYTALRAAYLCTPCVCVGSWVTEWIQQ